MTYANHSLISSADKTARIVKTPIQFDAAQDRARKILSAEMKKRTSVQVPVTKTGWLKGSLSYPWIFIAVGISALVQDFLTL